MRDHDSDSHQEFEAGADSDSPGPRTDSTAGGSCFGSESRPSHFAMTADAIELPITFAVIPRATL